MNIKDPRLLPEHMKRMLDFAERKRLGIQTEEERREKVEHFNERKLHSQVRQLLNLKGIVYLECRMDKRSHATVGWPDFTFSILGYREATGYGAVSCAWECKVDKAKLRPEQEEMHRRMAGVPNCWRVKVIRSLQEAADELKELGI